MGVFIRNREYDALLPFSIAGGHLGIFAGRLHRLQISGGTYSIPMGGHSGPSLLGRQSGRSERFDEHERGVDHRKKVFNGEEIMIRQGDGDRDKLQNV